MRKLSTAVLIAGIVMTVALTGCGGGGGSTGAGTGGGGGVTGNTIVIGRVVDDRTPAQPVKDVVIGLGSMTTNTGADGRFSFDLGSKIPLGDFLGSPVNAFFKVSTRLLNQTDYPEVSVYYQVKIPGTGFPQIAENGGASIPISSFELLMASGVTNDLGTVILQYNDISQPPPIPW